MAILKHLAIKKKDYSDIQQYLIFKCEEGTHRPLRDETGHMIQRDFFIQSGMNCNAFTFDAECVKLNHQFHKNNHKGDIMAHHFIISFDPRDAADHGLTPHKAHALAKEFAEYFFAGHQALIVTHADGNNHAGNIHTHIVINSLRKEKVEWRSFMENPRDCLPGYKHHLTDGLLHRMHERLGEICEREHLYTVEIDQPTDKKVTDREYQAQQRGQKETGSLAADTIKQKIRDAVDDAASRAGTELEFFNILRRDYSIRVNLKRGRYSYVHPDSGKPYTARSLGNAYSREVILEKLRVNRQPVIDDHPEVAALPRVFLVHSDLRLIVDLQSCVKAQQSRAYAQKVTISNIQKMADTVSWLEKNKMNSLNQLTAAKRDLEDRYYDTENDLRHVKNELVEVNQKIKHVGRYLSNKKVYARYQAAEDKDAFRAEYRSQIEVYEESIKALDELFMGDDFPSLKELKEKKAELVEKRDRLQAEYKPLAAEMRNMKVVWKNVCYILGRQAELEKGRAARAREAGSRAAPAQAQKGDVAVNAANDWSTIPQDKLDALAASLMPIEMLKEKLIHNEKGNVTQVIENCETVVREDALLNGAVRLNRMTGRLEIQKDMGWSRAGPAVNDNDMNNILSYMARNYDLRADKLCWRAITTAAYENGFHPIRDYLEGLEWDGTERIRHALRHFLGAPEDDLTHQCMKMFMIGALRRIYEPGCKFEYVLTLVGGQGIGKSTFFRFLAIQDKWFTDDLVGFKSSRIFEKISGHWIIEMSEMLAIMNAKGADEVKSFLSRQSDVYRDPYAVFPDDRPRQCAFGATTNRAKCLPFDRTGNRRFLPVLVDEAQAEVHILENEAESRAYIDQMWAEAMTLYRSGDYALKFPKDIEKQLNALRREFMAEDTNAGMIQMYLDGYEGDYVCVAQIYQEALHNPFTDPSRRDSIEITDIMRHSIEGWQPGPVHRFEKYGRQRSWVRVNQACQPSSSNPQAAVPDDDGFIEVPDDPDNPFITKDEPIRMRPP